MPVAPSTSEQPGETATPPPRFIALNVPARLWVPCALRPPHDEARTKAPGSCVSRGEWLTEEDVESQPAPLAPATGQVFGQSRVTLFDAREVPAVGIEVPEPAEAAAANPTEPTDPADPLDVLSSETAPSGPEGSSDFEPVAAEAVRDFLAGLRPVDLAPCVEQLRTLAVWADRWTSPDLTGQLDECLRRPPDIVLCSLLDADPALGVNRACAEAFPAEIVAAVAALARLTGATRAWLAVGADEDLASWAAIRRVAAEVAGDLRLVPVDNDYPQPDPTLLLYALTGRRLPPGRLPTEQGVLLLDAAAAAAVGRALVSGTPMLRVPMAIHDRTAPRKNGEKNGAGEAEAEGAGDDPRGVTHLVSVAVGTPLRDVLARLDILPATSAEHDGSGGAPAPASHGLELRAGGPLREMRLTGDCVVAGTELGVFISPREPDVNPDPCIRCGWCLEGCPVRIHPAGLLEAAQANDADMARRYGLHACIECGICSYVCPSHLPLLHGIRTLRGERELAVDE